jgi:Rod binding domain-containing protein
VNSIDVSMTGLQSTLFKGQEQAQLSKLDQMKKQYLHPTSADQKKMKQAAQDFEAVFVQQMLEMMDKTVDRQDSFLSGGTGEDYWRSMMNQEVAKSISTRTGGSGFGLAESIYRQMAANIKQDSVSSSSGSGKLMGQGEVNP